MYKFFKRTLDIVLSFLGMIALSPFFLLLVLAIKLDSKGPVLFKQKRVGLHKKHFYILKFRILQLIYLKILSNGLQRLGNFLGRHLWMSCLRFGIFLLVT